MEIDKDLRRNMKHVHDSYLFHCEHYGFEDDIYIGVGMMASSVYDEIIEKIESGFYGEKWKTLFASSPKTIVDIAKALYVCSDCGHYMSDYNLGLYVLKDGLTEQELELAGQEHPNERMQFVYLYNMMWSKQYYRKIGDYVHRCPSCNKRMHLGGYNDKPICPKCGRNGNIEAGRIIWD